MTIVSLVTLIQCTTYLLLSCLLPLARLHSNNAPVTSMTHASSTRDGLQPITVLSPPRSEYHAMIQSQTITNMSLSVPLTLCLRPCALVFLFLLLLKESSQKLHPRDSRSINIVIIVLKVYLNFDVYDFTNSLDTLVLI